MNKFKEMGNVHRLHADATPKTRVLVVDDHLDTVHTMAMLIKALGHEVDFAINGFAAIDAARSFRPNVILLDINLPDLKGDKLARQLKYEPGLEKTRLIAVSGLPEEELKERAQAAGCEEYFRKPMDAAVLEDLLSRPSTAA